MQNKTRTIIFALLLISIFSLSTTVQADWLASMYDVDYPTTVAEGEIFTITAYFKYNSDLDGCLSRWKGIYVFYSINSEFISSGNLIPFYYEQSQIYDSKDYNPAFATFEIDSTELGLTEWDVFRFKVRYWEAYFYDGYPANQAGSMKTTGVYTIIVTKETETPTTETGISIIGLSLALITSAAIVIKKRKIKSR